MKIDHLSSCNQPQTGGIGGQDAFVSAKKRAELPKDVLEALEEGDLEEALFLLRQHQQGSSYEGIFPDWILFRTLNNIYSALMNMLSAPKQKPLPPKKKVGKKEVEIKQAPPLHVRIKLSLKQLAATFAAYSLAAEKAVANAAKALARPVIAAAQTAYRAVLVPAEKYVAQPTVKVYKAVRTFVENRILALQQKFAVVKEVALAVKEKLVELRERVEEYSRPVKEWLSHKVNHFLENTAWVKQALGAQVVHVAKAAEVVINVIAYATVPFQFAAEQIKKPFNWLVKKAERIADFFKEAGRWTKKQLLKFDKSLSKGVLFLFKTTRVALSLLRALLRLLFNALRWLYNKGLEKVKQRQ